MQIIENVMDYFVILLILYSGRILIKKRYMKILKGYVKNQCRSEASIIERYISEEYIEFCSKYLSKAKCIGVPEKG